MMNSDTMGLAGLLRTSSAAGVQPRLRVTSNAEELWPKANWQSFDFGRSKQLFHTSQIGPPFGAFYWVTTISSAKRVSGWPRGWNLGGVTGELRRLGLTFVAWTYVDVAQVRAGGIRGEATLNPKP